MTHNTGSHEFFRILAPTHDSIRLARASLSMGLGIGWAMALTVGGGLLASVTPGSSPWMASTMFLGGLTLAIAGLFVFMVTVGGPVFPRASLRLKKNTEAVLGVAVLVGLACTSLTLIL